MQIFQGHIVTCDERGSVFRYLVEEGGRIAFVGNELLPPYTNCPLVAALGSRALLPAFGDGHIHFSNWALFNATFDVRSTASIQDIGPILKGYADAEPKAKVLFGFGHSRHTLQEKRLPTRRYEKSCCPFSISFTGSFPAFSRTSMNNASERGDTLNADFSSDGGRYHERKVDRHPNDCDLVVGQ